MQEKDQLVIVITGGAKGLGKFLADKFMSKGDIVNIVDIARPVDSSNGKLNYYSGDISDYDTVRKIFKDIYENYGRIDVLINNAAKRYFSSLEAAEPEDIFSAIKGNLFANYLTTKEALVYMKQSEFGRIINISSYSGLKSYPQGSIYCATKAALNIFSQAVAYEIPSQYRITINSVCPSKIYLADRTEVDEDADGLIKPEVIFKIICKLIDSNCSGQIIPIVSQRTLIAYILYQLREFCKGIRHILWKY